jgi:hypothetical protein
MTCAVKVVNRIVANARRMLSCARSLRTRLLCHRANCPEPRVRHSHGDRGRPLCPASQRRIGRPAAKVLDRAVKSQSSKALLRQRGMHLERSFEHVLDEGGMRRATLQGKENLTKRHKIAAACFNLSLLLRTLLGVGTPKQWMAGAYSLLEAVYRLPLRASTAFSHSLRRSARFRSLFSKAYQNLNRRMKPLRSSTVC